VWDFCCVVYYAKYTVYTISDLSGKYVWITYCTCLGDLTGQRFFYNTDAVSFDKSRLYNRRLSMKASFLCAKTAKWRFWVTVLGVKIFAVFLVLSQSTRVTDGQTDVWTDGWLLLLLLLLLYRIYFTLLCYYWFIVFYTVSQKNCTPKAGRDKFCYFPNTKKIRNIRFVGNVILNKSCEFYYDDITTTLFIGNK